MRAEGVDLMALHTYAMQRRLIAEQAVAISSVAGSRFTESMSWDRESVIWRMATLVPPDFLRMFRDASCLQRDAVRWLLAHNDLAELKLMEMLIVIDIDLYVASLDLQVEMGDLAERVTKAARPDLMGYLGGSAHRCTLTWTLDELVNMEADWRLVLQVLEANFPLSTTVEAARPRLSFAKLTSERCWGPFDRWSEGSSRFRGRVVGPRGVLRATQRPKTRFGDA